MARQEVTHTRTLPIDCQVLWTGQTQSRRWVVWSLVSEAKKSVTVRVVGVRTPKNLVWGVRHPQFWSTWCLV